MTDRNRRRRAPWWRRNLEDWKIMLGSAAAVVVAITVLSGAYEKWGGPIPATAAYVERVAMEQRQDQRAIRVEVLQSNVESLRRQLYQAREACAKSKDFHACDEANELSKDIDRTKARLDELQRR